VQAGARDQALRPFDRDRNLPAAAELERFHAANNAGSGTLLPAGSPWHEHASPDLRPGRDLIHWPTQGADGRRRRRAGAGNGKER